MPLPAESNNSACHRTSDTYWKIITSHSSSLSSFFTHSLQLPFLEPLLCLPQSHFIFNYTHVYTHIYMSRPTHTHFSVLEDGFVHCAKVVFVLFKCWFLYQQRVQPRLWYGYFCKASHILVICKHISPSSFYWLINSWISLLTGYKRIGQDFQSQSGCPKGDERAERKTMKREDVEKSYEEARSICHEISMTNNHDDTHESVWSTGRLRCGWETGSLRGLAQLRICPA